VTLVVLREVERRRHPVPEVTEAALEQVRDPELLAGPERDRPMERAQACRASPQVGPQDADERRDRLVVVDDGVEPAPRSLAGSQAVADGVDREAVVVLPAGESLLLRRRHERAVADERRGGVVVEGADAQDVHWRRPRDSSTSAGRSRA
jgi:hypothetical protein